MPTDTQEFLIAKIARVQGRVIAAGGLVLLAGLWLALRTGSRDARVEEATASAGPAASPGEPALAPVPTGTMREAVGGPTPEASFDGIILEGRVLDVPLGAEPEHGVGASGVIVRARAIRGLQGLGGEGNEPSMTTTAADGTFRLSIAAVESRPLQFQVEVDGDASLRGAMVQCKLRKGESRYAGMVLARYPFGALRGRTVDPDGRAIPSVEVALLNVNEMGDQLPSTHTLSDADGAFEFADVRDFWGVDASNEGYTLLRALRPKTLERGGWEPLELVLCARGTLRVQVFDSEGAPVPGIHVSAAVSSAERFSRKRGEGFSRLNSLQPTLSETDPAGMAVLAGIWAEQRLDLQLGFRDGEQPYAFLARVERVVDGAPVFEEDAGKPLVVPAGGVCDVRVVLALNLELRIRVVDAGGGGVPEAFVSLGGCAGPGATESVLQRQGRSNARGDLELRLLALRPAAHLLVTASDQEIDTWWGRSPLNDARRTDVRIDLAGRATGKEELMLVLQPTLAIAGRIVAERKDLQVFLRAVFAGEERAGLHATACNVSLASGGAFRLGGLPAGLYDLEFQPTQGLARSWMRGVAAGTQDLVVSIEDAPTARVVVEVVASEGTLRETIVLKGSFHPHDRPPAAGDLPREATFAEPFGWPPNLMLSLFSGGSGSSDELGDSNYSLSSTRSNPTTLELVEGLWWLGANARFSDGRSAFPVGTGLVHVGPGEHRVRFVLAPAAALTGRVRGLRGRELLVALATTDGRLVAVDVGREEPRELCDLGADGSFRMLQAPSGTFELRVGTRAELLEGRWTARQQLALRGGETRDVVIEL